MKKIIYRNEIVEKFEYEDEVKEFQAKISIGNNKFKTLKITNEMICGIFPTEEEDFFEIYEGCQMYGPLKEMIRSTEYNAFRSLDTNAEIWIREFDGSIGLLFGGQLSISTLEDDNKMYESKLMFDNEHSHMLEVFLVNI